MKPASTGAVTERQPSRSEIVTDAAVHAIGIAAGFSGTVVLLMEALPRGDSVALAAVLIYSAGLLAMWICSCAYNLAIRSPRRESLRCSDQSAIFAMIAGTYTPFTLLYLDGAWALSMTLLVWLVAGLGIALRIFHPERFERISIGLYLALGWVGLVTVGPMLSAMSLSTLLLLAIGGLIYTAGVAFHVWERLPFQTAIWHVFVLAAAACHYAAILGTLYALEAAL